MFEELLAAKADHDVQLVDFIELYARFTQDVLRVSGLINQGKSTNHDRFRMRQFEAKIDMEWRKIPEAKREVLIRALLAKKLLPEELSAALAIFGGKVTRLV